MALYKGGKDADTIYGTSAADVLRGLGGDDLLYGGSGDDRIFGGSGSDLLEGGFGRNRMFGGSGDDVFRNGYGGDDRASGGSGDDVFEVRSGGGFFDGGTGIDTLSFTDEFYGVRAVVNGRSTFGFGGSSVMRSKGIENLAGGSGDDRLKGSNKANTLDGSAGDDLLLGRGGRDTLIGGEGRNRLEGGSGDDAASYATATDAVRVSLAKSGYQNTRGAGQDKLIGIENLIGSDFNDTLTGNGKQNTLAGGLGNDALIGGGGRDAADYSDAAGGVEVSLAITSKQETGAAGRDRLAGIEDLVGSAFKDQLFGNKGANGLYGGGGDDLLWGRKGRDVLNGGSGSDIASYREVKQDLDLSLARTGFQKAGSAGSDRLVGIEGIEGGSGDDTLAGNRLANTLIGNDGRDELIGGGGDDVLRGGLGRDTLKGQNGSDTADYSDIRAPVVVNLNKSGFQDTRGGGRDKLVSIENATGGRGDDRLVGDAEGNVLNGGNGDDVLLGGAGRDILIGGKGDDVLDIGAGKNERLIGGAGSDSYMLGTGAGRGLIEDVLGAHDTIDASKSSAAARINLETGESSTAAGQKLTLAPGGFSTLPLDLMFLQDLSGSFDDDIATVRGLVPKVIRAIDAANPDSAYGIVGFVDKPVSPFGSADNDYVYELIAQVSPDGDRILEAYQDMETAFGDDDEEAQIEALMQVAKRAEGEVGFRDNTVRAAILFTDAGYHRAGDGAAAGINRPNDGDDVIEGGGTREDYPSVAQLAKALADSGILPIFAVTSGVTGTYEDLIDELGVGTLVNLESDSGNIVKVIKDAVTFATQTAIEDAVGSRFGDTLLGSTLDNVISGGKGGDVIRGRTGDDRLFGGEGRDEIHGEEGADTLTGGKGNDRLFGGAGDDTLVGGPGTDRMTGGEGADSFVFRQASESTPSGDGPDWIRDFSSFDGDKVDLSRIDADTTAAGKQAFRFEGTAAFTSTAGELRYEVRGDGILVEADRNGDGTGDFAVLLQDIGSISSLDLIL